MELLFFLLFAAALIVMLSIFVRMLLEWHKNSRSPRLTVEATIVAKRSSTSHSQQPVGGDITGAHGFMASVSTTCYVTFQVGSGDRMELRVPSAEFGLLAEGDRGQLTFQGTRFVSFERISSNF